MNVEAIDSSLIVRSKVADAKWRPLEDHVQTRKGKETVEEGLGLQARNVIPLAGFSQLGLTKRPIGGHDHAGGSFCRPRSHSVEEVREHNGTTIEIIAFLIIFSRYTILSKLQHKTFKA